MFKKTINIKHFYALMSDLYIVVNAPSLAGYGTEVLTK